MKGKAVVFGLVALLLVIGTGSLEAQAKTIWDGIYTSAQAERGAEVTQRDCGACHSAASEWGNPRFIAAWAGQPVSALHGYLRDTMPVEAPGRLTDQEYSDIVAYLLRLNDVPTGDTELSGEADVLTSIQFTRAASQ
jgi:S-disulfanyl-L-cysteine oxidoreductase SoxD